MQPRWQRLAVVLACFAILAFFLARGGEKDPEPPAVEPDPADELLPLPPLPEPEPPHERARGVYVLETADTRVSLELMHDRRFRFLTTRSGNTREGSGTWSLTGRRLTLAYTHINGKPVGDQPTVAVNIWNGSTIELKETGIPGRVILRKRTMIKRR